MVAVEIVVALIGGGVSIVTPLLGYYIYKWKKKLDPEPSEEKYCQILETEVSRVGGFPLINTNRCQETKSQCPTCNKYFCPFHKTRNNNGDLNGGHICPDNNP